MACPFESASHGARGRTRHGGPALASSSIVRRTGALFAISAAAAGLYAGLSRRVAKRETRTQDTRARHQVLKTASRRARKLAEITGHIGKWYTHVPLSIAGGGLLASRGRAAAATTLATSSVVAAVTSRLLDRVHDQRTPPPGKRDPSAQSYPSGHALETTTVAIAAGWILARERLAPAAVIAPVGVLAALVSGLGRLVLDRHWTTDSIAGYLAGIALGTACAGAYELAADC